MTVFDLIIKLQKLDPNKKVMLDLTKEEGRMFNFKELAFVDEVGTPEQMEYVVMSPFDYEVDDEESWN